MINYVLFYFKQQVAGIAIWDESKKFLYTLFVDNENFITNFNQEDIFFILLIKEKINFWIHNNQLPNNINYYPWQDQWWIKVKDLLIHNIKLGNVLNYSGIGNNLAEIANNIIDNLLYETK